MQIKSRSPLPEIFLRKPAPRYCGSKGVLFAAGALLIHTLSVSSAFSDEELLNQPVPESADELRTSSVPLLEVEKLPEVETTHRFFQESKVTLNLRNYYRDEAGFGGGNDSTWAQGGGLRWRSGKYRSWFSLDTELFGSVPIYVPSTSSGGGLLKEGGDPYGVLGVLNPRLYFGKQQLSLFRQRLNFAYLNQQDSRMTPNTFEGYLLERERNDEKLPRAFEYLIGYLDKMKKRNSDRFIPMSEAAGADGTAQGTVASGLRFYPNERLTIAAANYYTPKAINIFYAETSAKGRLSDLWAFNGGLQYSAQDTQGKRIFDETSSTGFWGAKAAASVSGAIFQLAYNRNERSADLISPFGSQPSYTSRLVEFFQDAGAETWMGSVSTNLSRFGVKGFSFITSFAETRDGEDMNTESPATKAETDFVLSYSFPEEGLRGLKIQLSASILNRRNGDQQEEYRAIVNYRFNVLGDEVS